MMTRYTELPLAADHAEVAQLLLAAGTEAVYVTNALQEGEDDGFLLRGPDGVLALVWFGRRGNLLVLGGPVMDAAAVVAAIVQRNHPWRLAMGPALVLDALRAQLPNPPLVYRDQVYYEAQGPAVADGPASRVRDATAADRDRLVQATLQLNHSDLNIDPARVDRRWLRETVAERIATATTKVIGPPGGLWCKLDHGSDGPAGLVLEGVFTFPTARGQGLASELVTACIQNQPQRRVCLHVAKHNAPARRAYERAGMAAVAQCRLLLRY